MSWQPLTLAPTTQGISLLNGSSLLSTASLLPNLEDSKILAVKSDTSGLEWVTQTSSSAYTLQQSYGKCRLLKDGVLGTEIDVLPTPVDGRYLKYVSGAYSWATGRRQVVVDREQTTVARDSR